MKISDILSRIFQICWVTNDLDKAVEHFKKRYDVERFLVRDNISLLEVRYRGAVVDAGNARCAWANAGDLNLELIQPESGFTLDLYGPKVRGPDFKMALHHVGARFDEDLDGYEAAVQAMELKGYSVVVDSGIEGISRFSYFDMEQELGHYLEILYLNSAGVNFLNQIAQGDFE